MGFNSAFKVLKVLQTHKAQHGSAVIDHEITEEVVL